MTKLSFGLLAAAASLSASAAQVTVYSNDFASGAGSAWSTTATSSTPIGGNRFLGEFANDAATLTLNGLGSHSAVTISFDLYVLKSWDGDSFTSVSPDLWGITVNGNGPFNSFLTTFSNGYGPTQSYPGFFIAGSAPARTGAVANDTLGYGTGNWGDSVYHLTFTTPHTDSTFAATLKGANLQGVGDESWGVDNVTVSIAAVPEPESYVMFLAGLGMLGGIARRRTTKSL